MVAVAVAVEVLKVEYVIWVLLIVLDQVALVVVVVHTLLMQAAT